MSDVSLSAGREQTVPLLQENRRLRKITQAQADETLRTQTEKLHAQTEQIQALRETVPAWKEEPYVLKKYQEPREFMKKRFIGQSIDLVDRV